MTLYVVRHGLAASAGEAIRRDADRPLTEQGVADAALVGAALARLDGKISVVLCSPFARARQTADAIAAHIPAAPRVRETESLSPGTRPAALIAELQAFPAGDSRIVVVGHQPDLGTFISHVIEGEPAASIDLPPGAMACLRFSGDSTTEASLRCLLVPDMLRKLLSSR